MRDATGSYRNDSNVRGLGTWASWLRPRTYWTVVVYHFPLALISGGALSLPYAVTIQGLPLIPCTFLHLTGFPCPFCGFTRSFWSIAAGEWQAALFNCPLAFGVYFCLIALFVWNVAALMSGVVLFPGSRFRSLLPPRRSVVMVVCGLFLLNWGYRLAMGLK